MSRLMRSSGPFPVSVFRLSPSRIQSSMSMSDVLRPRFGGDGDGDGDGLAGVRTTGGGRLAVVEAESGASMREDDDDDDERCWSSSLSALRALCEVAPAARDSKAAMREAGIAVNVQECFRVLW